MTNKLLLTILLAVLGDSSIHVIHGYLLNQQEEAVSKASYFPFIVLFTVVVYTLTLYQAKDCRKQPYQTHRF
jgi:hypothetical protein